MKTYDNFFVLSNEQINPDTYRMVVEGNTNEIIPGQFARLKINNKMLSNPYPIAFNKNYQTTIVYRSMGKEDNLKDLKVDDKIEKINIIGNGFNIDKEVNKPLLIANDIGLIPIYYLAKKLKEKGLNPEVIVQYNSKDELLYLNELHELGVMLYLALENDNILATYYLEMFNGNNYDYIYGCGPKPFIKAVSNIAKSSNEMLLIDTSTHEDGVIIKKIK